MPAQKYLLDLSRLVPRDPRYYQIALLASLLIYGAGWLDFDIDGHELALLLGPVLVMQFFCGKYFAAARSMRAARSFPAFRFVCCCAPTAFRF